MDKLEFAIKMSGVKLTPIGKGTPIALLGTGSGIVMAYADYLYENCQGIKILAADLTGNMGVERRCVAIDYISQALPTTFILWSGLCSATSYPRFMEQRDYVPQKKLWVYVRGIDDEKARSMWEKLGATIIDRLWVGLPDGLSSMVEKDDRTENLLPNPSLRFWECNEMGIYQ